MMMIYLMLMLMIMIMMSFNSITRDKVMARRNLGIAMQQDIIWVSDGDSDGSDSSDSSDSLEQLL
jgi:hypothetical protein